MAILFSGVIKLLFLLYFAYDLKFTIYDFICNEFIDVMDFGVEFKLFALFLICYIFYGVKVVFLIC